MALGTHDIENFLHDYAAALSDNDPQRIAGAWHIPSLVVAHGAAVAVSAPEQISRFFAAAAQHYRSSGIHAVKLRESDIRRISDRAAHATVTWELQDAAGRPAGTENGFYVLSSSGPRDRAGIDFFAHD